MWRATQALFPRLRVPSLCRVCATWAPAPICSACVTRFASARARCRRCAIAMPTAPAGHDVCMSCQRDPGPLAACVAVVDYGYPWMELIRRYKFDPSLGLAAPLGHRLADSVAVQRLMDESDVIAPIPLPAQRLAERGFNQSWELAKTLRRRGPGRHARFVADLLHARDQAPEQHQQSRQARLRLAPSRFRVAEAVRGLIEGRHVLLIDDVMTTGATLRGAAQALLGAGAGQVSAAVLARTPAPGED